jgi:hypothetical protein
MSTQLDEITTIEFIATPVSMRADQRKWIDAEALRQLHGNRSRIVQEAIDLYRKHIEEKKEATS